MSSGVSGLQSSRLLCRTSRYRSRKPLAFEITEEAISLSPRNLLVCAPAAESNPAVELSIVAFDADKSSTLQ